MTFDPLVHVKHAWVFLWRLVVQPWIVPDHVAQVPSGMWGAVFVVSAVMMAVIEVAACGMELWAVAAFRREPK